MANPYEQAAGLAAPFAHIGSQILQGQSAYEAGRTKMAKAMAEQAMFDSRAESFGASARKNNAEAESISQRTKYQTPEFARQAAATSLNIPPQALAALQAGSQDHGLTPEQVQRFAQLQGAQQLGWSATKDGDSSTMMDTFAKLIGTGASPQEAVQLGRGMAAAQGKPLVSNLGGNGVFDQFTGEQSLNAVGKSAANENNAQAGNANASAKLSMSKIGQPTVDLDGSVTNAPPPKPMPAAALKMQQENLENLSVASNINPMLQRFAEDIDSKKLTLGPVANLVNKGKNFAGSSDEGSRNFASFQATLEKLRNDSLRLNKGVQTDGDAQRAWNELMSNINDPGVVKQRIQEIQEINDKAVELHRMNINQVRRNYGHQDIDVSGYTSNNITEKNTPKAPSMSQTERQQSVLAARDAIAKGRNKAAVIQRLEEAGITDHGIK